MHPALFVVGTPNDINFVHIILEALYIDVSASELYKINKVRYKFVDRSNKHKTGYKDKKVDLKGCIFSLPTTHPFHILKECIVGNIEMQCHIQKHKVNFYYNVTLVDKFIDILNFKSGDATFSNFLKTCGDFNILIQDH